MERGLLGPCGRMGCREHGSWESRGPHECRLVAPAGHAPVNLAALVVVPASHAPMLLSAGLHRRPERRAFAFGSIFCLHYCFVLFGN